MARWPLSATDTLDAWPQPLHRICALVGWWHGLFWASSGGAAQARGGLRALGRETGSADRDVKFKVGEIGAMARGSHLGYERARERDGDHESARKRSRSGGTGIKGDGASVVRRAAAAII